MKFTGICYNQDTGEYVVVTQDGEIWAYGFHSTAEGKEFDDTWEKIADAPEFEE